MSQYVALSDKLNHIIAPTNMQDWIDLTEARLCIGVGMRGQEWRISHYCCHTWFYSSICIVVRYDRIPIAPGAFQDLHDSERV